MTSNDRDILLEINGRLIKIESRLDGVESRLGNLESRVGNLEQQTSAIMIEQAEQRGALNYIHSSLSVWGSIICGIIAFVGIFAPKFWEYFSRKAKPAPEIDIDELADKVIQVISSRYELKPKR